MPRSRMRWPSCLRVGETWQGQERGLSRALSHSAWDSSLGSPPSTTRSAVRISRRYSHVFESGGRSSSESPGRRGLRFPGIRKMRASAVGVAVLVRQTYRKAEQVVLRKLRRASLYFDISRSSFFSPFCPLLHQSRPSWPFACSSSDCGSFGVLRHRPPRASVCSYFHMARRSSRRALAHSSLAAMFTRSPAEFNQRVFSGNGCLTGSLCDIGRLRIRLGKPWKREVRLQTACLPHFLSTANTRCAVGEPDQAMPPDFQFGISSCYSSWKWASACSMPRCLPPGI